MINFKKSLTLILSPVLVLCMAGQAFCLTLTGSTTVFPIAQACAEEFSDMYPSIKVAVTGGGSSVGIATLMDKGTDIGMASRPISTKEIKSCRMKGVDPVANIISLDGIAVIVNPSCSLADISIKNIKDIYTGKISNWSDLGLKKGKIVVISRDSSSGTYEAFNSFVLKGEKVMPEALMEASNQAIVNIVASTPGAIGYVGMGYIKEGVKALTVNGVYPTKETVANNKYPMSRPLFMYTNGKPTGDTKKFIDFVFGKRGQQIVEEQGFIAVK